MLTLSLIPNTDAPRVVCERCRRPITDVSTARADQDHGYSSRLLAYHDSCTPEGIKPMSIADLGEQVKPIREEMSRLIQFHEDNNTITLHAGGYSYEVDLDQITEPIQLVGWAHQLCRKTWMRTDIAAAFIKMVCTSKGWQIGL
ncbi:hypothetical protein [Roseimicrobium sp. ORNL1]|uniref:hypothetical protein n=1 Tax=Roseimicrobium sp. ORNL1 TaxID=2711231 RepID=UPI0013E17AF3|nr:hypothetical protein [Roseimicrobium sp. ORNL1]QIF04314.1 hypothetical protein G5S37_23250 [Roseimicrobium sp. ORNL1]